MINPNHREQIIRGSKPVHSSSTTPHPSSAIGNNNEGIDPASCFRRQGTAPEHKHTPERALTGWRSKNRRSVDFSHHDITQMLIEATTGRVTVSMYYHGGSDRGRFRKFTPECVFRTANSAVTYVSGFCHLRQAYRVLRTDRISLA